MNTKDGAAPSNVSVAQIRSKLQGVDYIFLDEVSMVSCPELYKISSQLSKALNTPLEAFGGMNMIFAGDFAQLPPTSGGSLYSGSILKQLSDSFSVRDQEATIGKALWHQVTTIVILCQNMRQKSQSESDSQLREALINMRYATCTKDNIEFLNSRVASRLPGRPKLSDKQFRNVSVITAHNAHKDKINEIGTKRFAVDTGQVLTEFYSVDRLSARTASTVKSRGKKTKANVSGGLSTWLQEVIWNLPHSSTDHLAGKLSLCIGLPVMIRNNDATEMCITKGQEGFVAGWQAAKGPSGQNVLDTLFVRLDNPPKDITIPGLPLNIVPLSRATKPIICTTPNDMFVSVERSQVHVLPNFGMTDYASQGKTRKFNVVDLNMCKDHCAYYTCLSRGSTAEGTIIVQPFKGDKITRGASGYLRQEFREHELLDEITRLRYEGVLPDQVKGTVRNALIRSFQLLKGVGYVPKEVHNAIHWSESEPFELLPEEPMTGWTLVAKQRKPKTPVLPICSSIINKPITTCTIKRVADIQTEYHPDVPDRKRQHLIDQSISADDTDEPVGFIWDSENWSCAYDSLFTILCDIWTQNHIVWSARFNNLSQHSKLLADCLEQVAVGEYSMEEARDKVRSTIHQSNTSLFPYGQRGAPISELCNLVLGPETHSMQQQYCKTCGYVDPNQIPSLPNTTTVGIGQSLLNKYPDGISVLDWFRHFMKRKTRHTCPKCFEQSVVSHMYIGSEVNTVPNILVLDVQDATVHINTNIKITVNNKTTNLRLRGIIYHGGFHFTSRIITPRGNMWYNDGASNCGKSFREGSIYQLPCTDYLNTCRGRSVSVLVYSRK